MKRDINKTLAAYKKLRNIRGDFYLSDLYSLRNYADGKKLFHIIDTALRYGYVSRIPERKAQDEESKRAQK